MSFLIPHEAYPGRVAILFTLFLCTGNNHTKTIYYSHIHIKVFIFHAVNTLNEVSTKSPRPKTNATALVLWIQTCLFYIVAAMAEFACLLIASKRKEMNKGKGWVNFALTISIKHLDKVMVVFYPIIFTFNTITFWSSVANK